MSITSGHIRLGGAELHYERRGEGPAVVLINDTPEAGALRAPLAQVLAPGFALVTLDLPGHGRSPAPADWSVLEVSALADLLWAGLAELGVERPMLYARPSAAPIVLRMAAEASGRLALAVIDPCAAPSADVVLTEQADPAYTGAYAAAMRRAGVEAALSPVLAPVVMLAAPDATWTAGPVFPTQPWSAGCHTQHLPDDRVAWPQALAAVFAAGSQG